MSRGDISFFHPLIRKWFSEKIGLPTDVQLKAWPEIVKGSHVLVTAPTGAGKTLAAFLWGMNQLIAGTWPGGAVRLLYVSPLKALNNDVRRNLLKPLHELKQVFEQAGESFPEINVLTRSGDTPGEERRRMVRKPPEILITTPESLNILLASRTGRAMLTGIASVILDEIHAVAGSKRGTHLITAVDRLAPLSGEFQRIALSATVNPVRRIAEFVGGYRLESTGHYEKRPVSVIRSEQAKSYDIKVAFPSALAVKVPSDPDIPQQSIMPMGEHGETWWPALTAEIKKIINKHRSTLLFANSRRHAEKIVSLINEGEQEEIAYAHHGSLSREIRLAVEQKLKNGELKAIVATNSLELGIDIGALDQVVLIQTPGSVSSALQRIGRSGHAVGEKSRGLIFPIHRRDFVDAAVMLRAVLDQDIEEVRPVEAPLDVLAQVILSMTAAERRDIDRLYAFLKTSYPFHGLPRRHFDILLEMLSGRYADTRLRDLKARVSVDRLDNTVEARSGTAYLIYTSGGTIPERGYFDLRVKDTRAKIGELDEEFVWERSIGDSFILGAQAWRIQNITHNDVEVVPASSAAALIPFWRAEELNRDFHLSEKIGLFLERADKRLDAKDYEQELRLAHGMDQAAALELISFLKLQKEASGADLPHRRHLLMEFVEDPAGRGGLKQIILHTFWGGRVNRPFSLAFAQAWEEEWDTPLQIVENDDAILVMTPEQPEPRQILDLLSSENVEAFLRKKLEQTGFFGARFRENAERALLLPKPSFKRRMPLWLIRIRAKELLEAVRRYEDFPIMIETWRTCLRDEFDLENLKLVLRELREGSITVTRTITRSASPFAGAIVRKQTSKHMYEDDTPLTAGKSQVRPDLISQVLFSSQLRPKIPADVTAALDRKLKRIAPSYSPGSGPELLDWVKERLLIPEPEWKELAAAIRRDRDSDAYEWLRVNAQKIAWVSWPGVRFRLLIAIETVPKALVAFRMLIDDVSLEPVDVEQSAEGLKRRVQHFLQHGRHEPGLEEYDLPRLLGDWLSYYGPIEKEALQQLLGVTSERIDEAVGPLIEEQDLIADKFGEESRGIEICDKDNLEMLLRMARRYRQPSFQPLTQDRLPLYFAVFQGIAVRGESLDDLRRRLEQLFGWPAPVGAWEEHILPARMERYRSEWLDDLMRSSDLVWFGCGPQKISMAFREDIELFHAPRDTAHAEHDGELDHLIPDRKGKYSFFDIAGFSHLDTVHATEKLWKEAWKGNVTSDSFQPVRKGVMTGFKPHAFPGEAGLYSRRSGFNRWKVSRPLEGHWLRIDQAEGRADIVEEGELAKDRVRQLLKRYGVLFREMLANEQPLLQWRAIFQSLRLMELSGEVLSGYFFEGIPGPQFISHEALRMLREPLPEDSVFWINATDPASLCGTPVQAATGLPPRIPSTHLVYHGSRLVMISQRHGRNLRIMTGPEDARLPDYFRFFRDLLTREFNPSQKINVETINGEPARQSPFFGALKLFGFKVARNGLELWREF